jgi:uncharacterized protein YdaU (DUF1376 family)
MHYYKFNIADWHLATSHLSLEEEAVYFKLINFYYDSEAAIPLETDSVIRRLRLGSVKDIVGIVLKEFFVLQDDGWHHLRCDDEISKYHHKAEVNQRIGKLGGRPKKTETVLVGLPEITLTTNQEPLTSSEPTTEKTKKRKTTLKITKDTMPESYEDFCREERPDLDPLQTYYKFCDHWLGCGETKADWFATWRNWVRNERKQVKTKPTVDFFDELMRTAK